MLRILTDSEDDRNTTHIYVSVFRNKGDPLKLTAQMLVPGGFRFSFVLNETRESFFFAKKGKFFRSLTKNVHHLTVL